jgi:glycosyltransferase involved in cell wall biosynthesis
VEKHIAVEDMGIDVWFHSLKRFMKDIKRTAELLKNEECDLAFGMMHYPSSLLVFAKQLFHARTRVIASPRGPSIEYLRYFEHKVLRKLCLRGIFSLFLRYADGVIVNSAGMKGECMRDFRVPEQRIAVVPNCVDLQTVQTMSGEHADITIKSSIVFSSAGRLEKEKNLAFLLRTFARVRKETEAKLLIIGEGSEKAQLHRLSEELDIAGDIIFVGYQRNPYKYIVKSDILIHTCLFEGFPNIILEAMAFGVPVVAMDCPYGPRDIIKHGENGFLIPMNDEGALVKTLLTLAGNRALRELIAKKGLERVGDFSARKMVDGYESFFCTVAQSACTA